MSERYIISIDQSTQGTKAPCLAKREAEKPCDAASQTVG